MRSKTATWFECKVRYDQTQENGIQKAVTEQYVVDALSFAEAEKRITEEMAPYISGEFEVTDIKKAAYKEIFFIRDEEKAFHNEVEEMTRAMQKGNMKKADEVFHRPLEEQTNTESRYYKAKLQFITIDEKTQTEKEIANNMLVQAGTFHDAVEGFVKGMKGSLMDYRIASVQETKIMDVFRYVAREKKEV